MSKAKRDTDMLMEAYEQVLGEGISDRQGETIDNFGGLEKYVSQQYGSLLPYIVEFSNRDNTQVVNLSPILKIGDRRQADLGNHIILTSNGYAFEPPNNFEQLTLDNFKKSRSTLAKMQELVPNFGNNSNI